MKSYLHGVSVLLVMLLISCNGATTKTESDLKSLFEMEVKKASKDMLKVKDVREINKPTGSSSSTNGELVNIDYEVTVELTEDAWRLVDANKKGSSNYNLHKNKPKPADYYGRGQTPILLKKGDTYKIIRTLKR